MRTLTIISIAFLITFNIYSQSQRVSNIDLKPQGNPIAGLNGIGISGLQNSVYNIGVINPAALSNFENISFGFSYQFQQTIRPVWGANFGFKRHYNFIPQSAGFIFPLGNFKAGISMTQSYNGGLTSEPIPITTIQYPDGTGEFVTLEEKNIIYKYSLIASYSFDKMFDDISISLGGRFNVNKSISGLSSTYDINLFYSGNNWELGTTIKKKFNEEKYLQFGLFYEKNVKLDLKESEGPGLLETPTVDDYNRPPSYYVVEIPGIKIPAKLKFDFDISVLPSIKFLGSISQIFWNDVDSEYLDVTEFTTSANYKFSDMVSSLFGVYKTDRKYADDYNRFFGTRDKFGAYFLTLGTSIKISNFTVDLALADSHLFSGDWRKQTMGKLGLVYTL